MLKQHYVNMDVAGLAKLYYQLQAGMSDLEKKDMVSTDIAIWYVRLIRSIDNTARKIVRKRYPNPCDNPLIAKDNPQWLQVKRERDNELAKYFHRKRF